jgi:hypothetical protein
MKARRTFLLRCSAVAAGALVMPDTLLAEPALLRSAAAHSSLAEFEKHLNTSFDLIREDGMKVTLKLIEAHTGTPRSSGKALSRRAKDADNEKFSLLFKGPRQQLLAQETYRFRHAALGEWRMFIVPVLSKSQRHYVYEAIFNRPRELKNVV